MIVSVVGALFLFQSCEAVVNGGWEYDHGWHHGYPHHEYPHLGPWHPVPVHGGGHYEGGHHGGSGHGSHHLTAMSDELLETGANADAEAGMTSYAHQDDSATQLASEFGIQQQSAEAILAVTRGGDAQQMTAQLGLDASDLAALAQASMPSQKAIAQVAKALGEDPAKIEKIAQSFVSDVSAQLSDVSSEYWQSCMSSGHWKTPENANCAKTGWDGCSPQKGATSCQAAQ